VLLSEEPEAEAHGVVLTVEPERQGEDDDDIWITLDLKMPGSEKPFAVELDTSALPPAPIPVRVDRFVEQAREEAERQEPRAVARVALTPDNAESWGLEPGAASGSSNPLLGT
jgi:hypothetical protein